jgi:hypothetical protein
MSKSDPLNLRPNDPVQKWRNEMERWDEECARERMREARQERRAAMVTEAAERRQLEAWIATLEESYRELQGQIYEATRVAAEAINFGRHA